ncbi:hypothetical protein ACFP1I_13390 [Dyadobacter subterraneus]|uniref:Uncharacterized protein n=2 Tax=Dyadobacter subterraneus TaxID=2773304 RepID=A0ABR9W9V6_9BACT|nr:hypothetical protein [Dyadobacter subterraneus]MBE9462227.1 hypothetical protein [Dyadobacter subterraneus]
MDNKQPEHIFVMDTTLYWPAEIFWPGWTGDETLLEIMSQPGEVHESYDPDYLYRDPVIFRLFSAKERVSLRKRAGGIKPKKISLKDKNYSTIHSARGAGQFYVMTTEPVFTSDGNHAFIYIQVHNKSNLPLMSPGDVLPLSESLFGMVTIIFQKQADQSWKKIKLINRLFL